jgi:hypothetical protein
MILYKWKEPPTVPGSWPYFTFYKDHIFVGGCTVSNCKDHAGAEHPDEEQSQRCIGADTAGS